MRRLGRTVLIGALACALAVVAACVRRRRRRRRRRRPRPTSAGRRPRRDPGARRPQRLPPRGRGGAARRHHRRTCPSSPPPSSTPIPPLTEQLELGLRSFELDLFEDPDGGRYGAPKAQALLGLEPIDPVMQEPGFKVFHIQEVDYRSHVPHLRARASPSSRRGRQDHPDHLPIVIHLEAKDGAIPDPLDLGLRAADPRDRGHLHRRRGRDPLRARRRPARHGRRRAGRRRHAACRHRGRRVARRRRPARPVRVRARRPRRQARPLPRPPPRHARPAASSWTPSRRTTTPPSPCSTTRWPTATASASSWRRATSCAPAPTPTPSRPAAATPPAARPPSPAARSSSAPTTRSRTRAGPGFVTDLPGDGPARCNPVSAPDDCDDADLRGRLRLGALAHGLGWWRRAVQICRSASASGLDARRPWRATRRRAAPVVGAGRSGRSGGCRCPARSRRRRCAGCRPSGRRWPTRPAAGGTRAG